ncbi:MAG: ClpXP protease specificity-enhancing factor SspB, partial [Pseudomonadota bacterium]
RDVLAGVAENGIEDPHHFYITFRTNAPGVKIPDYLLARYPEEMIVVLQHQFWDLEVNDDFFGVTLSFNERPERLVIPLAAIRVFADPGVEFGLQFTLGLEGGEAADEESAKDENKPQLLNSPHRIRPVPEPGEGEEAPDDGTAGAEIVSLDRFRKK